MSIRLPLFRRVIVTLLSATILNACGSLGTSGVVPSRPPYPGPQSNAKALTASSLAQPIANGVEIVTIRGARLYFPSGFQLARSGNQVVAEGSGSSFFIKATLVKATYTLANGVASPNILPGNGSGGGGGGGGGCPPSQQICGTCPDCTGPVAGPGGVLDCANSGSCGYQDGLGIGTGEFFDPSLSCTYDFAHGTLRCASEVNSGGGGGSSGNLAQSWTWTTGPEPSTYIYYLVSKVPLVTDKNGVPETLLAFVVFNDGADIPGASLVTLSSNEGFHTFNFLDTAAPSAAVCVNVTYWTKALPPVDVGNASACNPSPGAP
jgi:hypothetical protein